MILADLIGLVEEVQLVCDGDAMRPAKVKDLDKYIYCPIIKIKPGVYARKAIIRVYIDKHVSMVEIRRIKRYANRGRY